MRKREIFSLVTISLLLAVALTATMVRADDFDQAMKMTFSKPISIPDRVLPAGTYWFMLPAHGSVGDNVIQVMDGDRKNVIATLLVVSSQVMQPSGHVMITLADRSPKPEALLNLTYPGRAEGHTFEVSYSKQEQAALAEYPKISMKVDENGVMQTTETTK